MKKKLPFGSAVVVFVLIVVTFGLIVVGFTNGESGKTVKRENISNFKFSHLSVLYRNVRRTKGNMKKKSFIFSNKINYYSYYIKLQFTIINTLFTFTVVYH